MGPQAGSGPAGRRQHVGDLVRLTAGGGAPPLGLPRPQWGWGGANPAGRLPYRGGTGADDLWGGGARPGYRRAGRGAGGDRFDAGAGAGGVRPDGRPMFHVKPWAVGMGRAYAPGAVAT